MRYVLGSLSALAGILFGITGVGRLLLAAWGFVSFVNVLYGCTFLGMACLSFYVGVDLFGPSEDIIDEEIGCG